MLSNSFKWKHYEGEIETKIVYLVKGHPIPIAIQWNLE